MLLTAVHIDDIEITNDSVISHVSSSTFNWKLQTSETTAGVLRIYHHTIVTSQSLQHDFYWTKYASWNKQSVIGRLFGADNRPKHNRWTSNNYVCILHNMGSTMWVECGGSKKIIWMLGNFLVYHPRSFLKLITVDTMLLKIAIKLPKNYRNSLQRLLS